MATLLVAIVSSIFILCSLPAAPEPEQENLFWKLENYKSCTGTYRRLDIREYSGFFNQYDDNVLCIQPGRNIPYGYTVDSIFFKHTIK